MKATGIVRRIDDLGRIVVPKEIRRTLRIREGDALEISPTGKEKSFSKNTHRLGKWEILQTNMRKVWRRRLDIWCVSQIQIR